MVSMVRKIGTQDYEDVQADHLGEWSHSVIYRVMGLNEIIVSVVGNVVTSKTTA